MQQSLRMKIFSRFVQSVRALICKDKLELLHQRYYIREFKIWEIDASTATNLYLGIITRSKRTIAEKNEFRWLQNELRLFVWSICFYTLSQNIDISEMAQSSWQFFSELFPNKEKILFQYQASNLLKNHNQYKKWVHEEDQLFQQLVKRDKYRLRWSDLGKALFIESNRRFFRTAKQCRERWLNHLDPSKLKKYWLDSQDLTLIEYVKYNGKKWACISKKLENKRNQHSIKNRFKSLITRESKESLQPCSEMQLIDSLYLKLLKRGTQNQSTYLNRNQQQLSCGHQSDHFYSENQQHYQKNSQDHQANDHLDGSADNEELHCYQGTKKIQNKSPKQILGDISLNNHRDQEKSFRPHQFHQQNKIFQFTKMKCQESHLSPQNIKDRQACNQVQKRIRADLFLQQDPFQLLKGYFYKDNN